MKKERKKEGFYLTHQHYHSLIIDNNKPMPKHLKFSAFNEQRIFISYVSQHWSALIKK